MDDEEQYLADAIYGSMMDLSNFSDRSLQAGAFQMGVSDLGWCSEKARRMLDHQIPERTDLLAAFVGTWIGQGVETAIGATVPSAILQAEVTLVLEGDSGVYRLTGHPDVILPDDGILLDGKTDYGLNTVRRSGPSTQQQYQRHGYAKAAWDAGYFPDIELTDVRVANAWVDRAAIDKGVHVQMEPYDPDIVAEAGRWLDDVVYAYTHGEEARKEPPRNVCAETCGFFRTCRAYDTDVEGRLTDPAVLTAVEMYDEGAALEKRGRQLKDEAKAHLKEVSGTTGQFSIRWVHVNESEIKPGVRRAHDKLEIRRITSV